MTWNLLSNIRENRNQVNEDMEKNHTSSLQDDEIAKIKKADASVKTMEDFTSPEVLYEELIASVKKYHPSTDISMIQKAYEVAREAHKDQKRSEEHTSELQSH